MNMKRFPVYLALLGSVACGQLSNKESTVFRTGTDECRITQGDTPWLDIDVYQPEGQRRSVWAYRGHYNSATDQVGSVSHNHDYYIRRHNENELYNNAVTHIMACAKADPKKQERPVGFVFADNN